MGKTFNTKCEKDTGKTKNNKMKDKRKIKNFANEFEERFLFLFLTTVFFLLVYVVPV